MKPRRGIKPLAPQQKVRISSSGDDAMEKADEWCRNGAGVDDSKVRAVKTDPNEDIIHLIDEDHVR